MKDSTFWKLWWAYIVFCVLVFIAVIVIAIHFLEKVW